MSTAPTLRLLGPGPLRRLLVRTVRAHLAIVTAVLARATGPRRGQSDVRREPLGADMVLVTSWVERPGEVGPAVSVFHGHQELLRIDMFAEHPHVHHCPAALRAIGAASVSFAVGDEQVSHHPGRAAGRELRRHLNACLRMHPSARIRRLTMTDTELEWAEARVHALLAELADRHR